MAFLAPRRLGVNSSRLSNAHDRPTLAGDFVLVALDGRQVRSDHGFEAEDDPAGLHLRTRFDGAIFGLRGPRGRLVSWAALKIKSDHVWELAVATEADAFHGVRR